MARCPKGRPSGSAEIVTSAILGPVAGDGWDAVGIQIRDLDQIVIGNPAHDIIRLALSLATASRGSDLPGVTTARILEQIMKATKPRCAGMPTLSTKRRNQFSSS